MNWCFWTVVLEKTLKSPLVSKEIKPVHAKRSQPWIFIGRTDAEAEAPNFDHLMRRTDSLGKTLMLGKIEGKWERPWCWERLKAVGEEVTEYELDDITESMGMGLSKLWEIVKDREAWHAAVYGVPKSQTQLGDWTTIKTMMTLSGKYGWKGWGRWVLTLTQF